MNIITTHIVRTENNMSNLIAHFKGNRHYMYKEALHLGDAMYMGKGIAMSKIDMIMDDWLEIDNKSRKPIIIEPLVEVGTDTKIMMIKKMTKTKVVEYKPSFKLFNKETVNSFVNGSIMPFHFRRAHFRKLNGIMFIVRGCIINWHRCTLSVNDKQDILDGLETYNATILRDVEAGTYGVGTKLISYSEFLSMAS